MDSGVGFKNGRLEDWSDGVLEYWSNGKNGMLEWWNNSEELLCDEAFPLRKDFLS